MGDLPAAIDLSLELSDDSTPNARPSSIDLDLSLDAPVLDSSFADLNPGGLAEEPEDPRSIDDFTGMSFGTGRYTVGERLNAGAMGAVYRGVDNSNNAAIALKIVQLPIVRGSSQSLINKHQRLLSRCMTEATTAKQLSGP